MSEPKYHFIPQMELEWVRLHLGRPSASSFDRIMTTDFELRKGEGVRTYIYEKCAEMFRGQALPGTFTSYETEQGLIQEQEARDYYRLETGNDFRLCGFVESADRRCGCSPDAICGDDGGLEMKCPQPPAHVRYLIENRLPPDYVQQVHGSLYVTGRKWWDFYSYRRGFPTFRMTIHRDEEIMGKIETALQQYYDLFDKAYAKLKAYTP